MKSKKFLVVDDEKYLRDLLVRLFGAKYDVKGVENGFLAIDEIKKNKYHLVLLDIMMPGIDGIDVLKQIMVLDPKIRVVMMTGYAVEEKLKMSIALGALAFIHKPFELFEVEELIEEVERKQI